MKDIIGSKILKIEGLKLESKEVTIFTNKGILKFLHYSECCEQVVLNDFEGSAKQLVDSTITSVDEVQGSVYKDLELDFYSSYNYSDFDHEWTFYKVETSKGGLWMRWLGESNGYYSMDVSTEWTELPDHLKTLT